MPIHNSVKQTNNHNSNESDKYVSERTFRNALPQVCYLLIENWVIIFKNFNKQPYSLYTVGNVELLVLPT